MKEEDAMTTHSMDPTSEAIQQLVDAIRQQTLAHAA